MRKVIAIIFVVALMGGGLLSTGLADTFAVQAQPDLSQSTLRMHAHFDGTITRVNQARGYFVAGGSVRLSDVILDGPVLADVSVLDTGQQQSSAEIASIFGQTGTFELQTLHEAGGRLQRLLTSSQRPARILVPFQRSTDGRLHISGRGWIRLRLQLEDGREYPLTAALTDMRAQVDVRADSIGIVLDSQADTTLPGGGGGITMDDHEQTILAGIDNTLWADETFGPGDVLTRVGNSELTSTAMFTTPTPGGSEPTDSPGGPPIGVQESSGS